MIIISLKTFAVTVVILGFTSGCSICEKVVYRPDINQGNYLTLTEVEQICIGMKKQQVAYILGTPMMKDPFGTNTWFYVCRRQRNHEQITQQTLTLTFNSRDILIRIDNQPILSSFTSS